MSKLIWVGHRESELLGIVNMFSYSVTSWGSNEGKNISFCDESGNRTIDIKERNLFFVKTLSSLISHQDDKIMFYSQQLFYSLEQIWPAIKKHVIYVNTKDILDILNNKIHLRLWMSDKTNVPNYVTCYGNEFSYSHIHKLFPNINQFVVQEAVSAGGNGTYLCSLDNISNISMHLYNDKLYLISPFIENSVSVNLHLFIGQNKIIIFPGSIQIIETIKDKMVYRGADFIAYRFLSELQKNSVKTEAKKIAMHIKELGFRGICGLDFLVTEREIYFIEANPRYQASSSILNYGLTQKGLPSLQEIELQTMNNVLSQIDIEVEMVQIDYSIYKYYTDENMPEQYYNDKIKIAQDSPIIEKILYDGYRGSYGKQNDYLFSLVIKKHIVAVTPYNSVFIHSNIPVNEFISNIIPLSLDDDTMIKLKIALLNQGIRISDSAMQFIKKKGDYNESTFGSIDLIINEIHINAPVSGQIITLSPFMLRVFEDELFLFYHEKSICKVNYECKKSIAERITSRGIPYKKIAFINGDRLRLKTENACYYKVNKQGCGFCPSQNDPMLKNIPNISLGDIKEVFDYCILHESFKHIMIGGGSANPHSTEDKILPLVKYIRSKCNKEIYLMSTPPNSKEQLIEYISSGITEFAFNLELFDRSLAAKIMPAKGKIPLKHYLDMLVYAAGLLPKGSVRSMLLLGLEPSQKTLEGVECLCKNGIQPMLSIFRPVANCSLNYMVPPTNQDIYSIYVEALAICQDYGISLGPDCNICKNNTLALPQI